MDNYYFQQLYEQIHHQQKEINRLKSSVECLNTELTQLKEKPPLIVERLEYKFDQLKVETLEGTLNIGLNPSDLDGIEELSLPKQSLDAPVHLKEGLLERLSQYIHQEVETVIEGTERQLGKKLDVQYRNLIKEDIQTQLPARVDHYIQQSLQHTNRDQTEDQQLEAIYQQILKDIHQGIHAFISQIPQEQAGKKNKP
ncbi:spore germination protein GerPC [Lederbergia sp. NSJ-179]|uniref:spore germination protein GerPC n=1 Tax=Lederbergia sp. NSJ-179 TaxID=2931402 RepID=UPI001FD27FA9|nr:spore germination protein GerPC [Lederbergia sp. NSJ-179]MCJ7840383.1 spore germination protein GerPC [Lederbergia sp. NSJ-179]